MNGADQGQPANATSEDGSGAPHGDTDMAPIPADAGASRGGPDSLNAALAWLSSDTLAYLDLALDRLTKTSDLFDVPAFERGRLPRGYTADRRSTQA